MKKIVLSIALGTVLLAHTVTDNTAAGFGDWRLPSRRELLSIADKTKYNPAINEGFQNGDMRIQEPTMEGNSEINF